jgi:hypothetical protein
MRTPLSNIRMQADVLTAWLPEMYRGYELALAHGLIEAPHDAPDVAQLSAASRAIAHQVERSNALIDMVLASSRADRIDPSEFVTCRMSLCVDEAVRTYPFKGSERDHVHVTIASDFEFRGSQSLMVYVLFNLIKNSFYAIQAGGKGGDVFITIGDAAPGVLTFTDTGPGIPAAVKERIFEPYFSTKKSQGAGIGLAFCRRAIEAFGGSIACVSTPGDHATFTLAFPRVPAGPRDPAR